MSFSERLKQARAAAGKPQRVIAEAMGVSVQAVSQWENGQSTIQPDRLDRLAEILGVEANWLARGFESESNGGESIHKIAGTLYHGNQPCGVVNLKELHLIISSGLTKVSDSPNKLIKEFVFVAASDIISPIGIRIQSDQLSPDLREGDISIFDMSITSRPGDIVAVFLSMDGYFQLNQLKEQAPYLIPAIIRFDPSNPEIPDGIMIENTNAAVKDGQTPAIIMLGPLVERRTFPRRSRESLDQSIK